MARNIDRLSGGTLMIQPTDAGRLIRELERMTFVLYCHEAKIFAPEIDEAAQVLHDLVRRKIEELRSPICEQCDQVYHWRNNMERKYVCPTCRLHRMCQCGVGFVAARQNHFLCRDCYERGVYTS